MTRGCWMLMLAASTVWAERIEVALSYWRVDTSGSIQSGGFPVNFRSDLAVALGQPTFHGRLDLRPARRHRVTLEGTPFRLEGDNQISRDIEYAGRTYRIDDRIVSRAELTSFYAGYQFDVVANERGHLGFGGGINYMEGTGTLRSTVSGIEASDSRRAPLPAAATQFAVDLVPGSRLLRAFGDIRGMAFGDYGRFVHARGGLGIWIGEHVGLSAGYAVTDIDLHSRDGRDAISPRFSGPLFSLHVRD
jgi:hypothetical protein